MSEYFHKAYPEGMQASINPEAYTSVISLFNEVVGKFGDNCAFTCMGQSISYHQLDAHSNRFAAWLQNHSGLKPGDKIAIQLPNILQYPIVMFAALKAGLVVVNTNPLYSEREMEHQFNDSGAKLLVVYAGMADKAVNVAPNTAIEKVVVTEIADFHSPAKRLLINSVVKYVKKMVPAYDKSKVLTLRGVMKSSASDPITQIATKPNDTIVLQYTGGTTGIAKGAKLSNKNLIANMLQCREFMNLKLTAETESIVAPLPLYHIYAFTVHCLLILSDGSENILIPNPRDIPGFIKTLKTSKFTAMVGLNTLFVALMNHDEFKDINFNHLKLTISGGMALTKDTANRWQEITGGEISEGYGMTEASPVVCFNPPGHVKLGTIGIACPSTELKVVDETFNELAAGEIGELCLRGPQVMSGYYQRDSETEHAIDSEGWLRTGDMATIDESGYVSIVDRKKDMILVSGFNVYPNEVEEVVVGHPDVLECAAIGVKDRKTGEAVKAFITVKKPIDKDALIEFCRKSLAPYKIPHEIEVREELPKTNVGKILRRELR